MRIFAGRQKRKNPFRIRWLQGWNRTNDQRINRRILASLEVAKQRLATLATIQRCLGLRQHGYELATLFSTPMDERTFRRIRTSVFLGHGIVSCWREERPNRISDLPWGLVVSSAQETIVGAWPI